MLSVNKLLPRGQGLAAVLLKRAPGIELDWAQRQKSRFQATDSSGRPLDVALPPGSVLRGGDVLIANDGSLIRVTAAPQAVLTVRPCTEHGSPLDLLRAAHLLGRCGVAIDPQPNHLRIAPDAALAGLLRQRHLIVHDELAPFEPDPDEAHGHDHQQAHAPVHPAHDQHHDHPGHTSAPAAAAPPARGRPIGISVTSAVAPHVHGPGCGHAHAHPAHTSHDAAAGPAAPAHRKPA